jgi:pyruvate-formate lyase-activating enzyme
MDFMRTTIIDLTYRCNSPCRYCRWGNPHSDGRRDLPLDTVLLPSATLQTLGTSRVVFSGGEPLLYSWLEDVLRYYAQHVEQRVIITNGILLNDVKRRALRAAGATGFVFSVDSTSPKLYFATRGWRAEQLERVLGNIRCAAADGENLELSINAVVSRPTASWSCVGELLSFASSLALASVKFQPVFDDGYLSSSAPWLSLDSRDIPNLLYVADAVAHFSGVATNPPGFWRDLAAMAVGRRLHGRRCGLGAETVLVVQQRLARCYWIPTADLGRVSSSVGALQCADSLAELANSKPHCHVDARCFCLQRLPHEWEG